MTVKVAGSGEVVEQVFWLDLRQRTAGVMLRSDDGRERCSERPLADFFIAEQPRVNRAKAIENWLGSRAQVIVEDDS